MHDAIWKHPELVNSRNIVGKYQYLYTSKNGQISMIELPDYFHDGITLWEIYSIEGDLFEDTERFTNHEEALEAIEKYLI